MKKYFFVIILLIIISVCYANTEKKKVATFPFLIVDNSREIPQSEKDNYSRSIADSIIEGLISINADAYTFLARDEKVVQTILNEIDFQASGMTQEQAAMFGQQVTADYILSGSAVYYEGVYLVKAQLINVATGEIVASVTHIASSLNELRNTSVSRLIARELDNQIESFQSILEDDLLIKTIASVPFTGNAIPDSNYGDAIASLFINNFVDGGYTVLGRGVTVDKIGEEAQYQSSGLTENVTIRDGTRAATSYLLTGSIDVVTDYYIVDIKILDVNTGEIMSNLSIPLITNLRNQILINEDARTEIFSLLNADLNKLDTNRDELEKELNIRYTPKKRVVPESAIVPKTPQEQHAQLLTIRKATRITGYTLAGGLLIAAIIVVPEDKSLIENVPPFETLGWTTLVLTGLSDLYLGYKISNLEKEHGIGLSILPTYDIAQKNFGVGFTARFEL